MRAEPVFQSSRPGNYPDFVRPNALFVHDFVGIDLPFGAVVGAFAHYVSPDLLGRLVLDAWAQELAEMGRAVAFGRDDHTDATLAVAVGTPRARRDALVVPVRWRADSEHWVPPVEADLEIVAFGTARSHLHILGVSELPAGVAPCSDQASLEHRLTVALVRHVIFSLAGNIAGETPAAASRPSVRASPFATQ